jgi:hypothetical protein
MPNENKQDDRLDEYRRWLVAADQKTQEDFDKTVLTLSGGALGVSFAFFKDIVGPHSSVQTLCLLAAWISWALSTCAVLASYYLSHLSLRRAITQVDDGKISPKYAGGVFTCWTACLNVSGAILFFIGVCFIAVFAAANLPIRGETNERKEAVVAPVRSNAAGDKARLSGRSDETREPSPTNGGLRSATATTPAEEIIPDRAKSN